MIADQLEDIWLDKMPKEWKRSRIRNVATLSPSYSHSRPDSDELCTVVPMESLSCDGAIETSMSLQLGDVSTGLPLFEIGDVLFAKITPCMENGKGAFVRKLPTRYAFGSTEFHVLRPGNKINGQFLYYATFNPVYRAYAADNMVGAAGQKRVSTRFLKDTRLFLPSRPEQQRIDAYLDAGCAAIDSAVLAKRRQLETLEALRSSIIKRAVTQGLNAKVELKPSGLDWSPEVPAHWNVQQIKRLCGLVRGQFTHRPRNDPALFDGPYPFIQTGDITAAGKYIRSHSQTLNELGLSASKQFPRGTLVMSIAANIGDVAILDFEACFPDSMIGMIPSYKTNLDFLYYLMRCMQVIMVRSAVQSTQLNLNYVRIGTNFAPLPPLKEQVAIAEYLDAKESELRQIASTIEAQITTLTAYRKSLIHECVSGQRRITEAEVRSVKERAEHLAQEATVALAPT
jgi:type I restriction enzyme, S subunit